MAKTYICLIQINWRFSLLRASPTFIRDPVLFITDPSDTRVLWWVSARSLQSGNAQFGSKSTILFSRVTLKFDGWPWKTIGHLSSSLWIPGGTFSVVVVDRRYAARGWDSTWTVGYPDVSMTSWDSQWNEIYLVKAIKWTQDSANFNICTMKITVRYQTVRNLN